MEYIFAIALTAFLGFIGFVFGRMNEKSHYRSIESREKAYAHILIFNEKVPPTDFQGQNFYLVNGSVVMSGDYFKQIVAGLKMIFGGRVSSYESMLDRGRREAILRMKKEALSKGATVIFNVHLNTSVLNDNNNRKGGTTCAEILAYGTAWVAPQP